MTPTTETPQPPSRWKAILKAVAFAAMAAAIQGLSAAIADPAHPASWSAIGTTAGVSASIGAIGYLLRSPLNPRPPEGD